MDKKTLVDKLQKEGYAVTLEENVPMFTMTDGLTPEKIKKLLQKYDYVASFGYRKVTGKADTIAGSIKEKTEKNTILEIVEEDVLPEFQTETDGQYSLF